MKTNFKFSGFRSGIIILLILVFSIDLYACEACNRSFLNSLLGQDKFNSLISKELRATIAAQSSKGESPVKWVNDILAMNNMTVADLSPDMLNEMFAHAAPITPSIPHSAGLISTESPSSAVSATMPAASAYAPAVSQSAAQGLEFFDIINRDKSLPVAPTSYVPQNTKPNRYVRVTLQENETYIGNGVVYKGFTMDNKIPGPNIIIDEGDIVSFTLVNEGNLPHGASIHAVYSQTSKYLGKINPGDSATVIFQANTPGVYMYHCAPGGHAIPMHIIFGQYGMIVVQPKAKYEMERILNKKPDIELYLIQHEYYASGKDAVDGQGKPMYTAFNGKLFRYIEDPIVGKPGDYVRIYFLNAGPNLVSTFHIVGIIWDFAYWQGNPVNRLTGGQTVTAGPSDAWVIEFRIPPDEGNYLMLSHAVGSTDRGALGYITCDPNAPKERQTFLAEGIEYSKEEMDEYLSQASRIITPFGLGSDDVEVPVVYDENTEEVIIRIIGNSYHPKVVQVAPGTNIKWINEDVFSFTEGEFSGIHNVIVKEGPEIFFSPLLAHTENYTQKMEKEGEYIYMCAPHPYMEGKIIVKGAKSGKSKPQRVYASAGPTETSFYHWSILAMVALALMVSVYSMVKRSEKQQK